MISVFVLISALSLTYVGMMVLCDIRMSLFLRLTILGFLTLWELIPGYTALFLQLFGGLNTTLEFGYLYSVEGILVAMALAIYVKKRKIVSNDNNRMPPSLIIYSLLFVYFLYVLSSGSQSYLESNDISKGLESGVEPFIFGIVGAFVAYVALFSKKKLQFYLAFLIICLFTYNSLESGGRIILTFPIFIMVYRALKIYMFRENIFKYIACMLIGLFFIVPLSSSIEKTRGKGEEAIYSFEINEKNSLANFVGSLNQKFNGFDTGAILLSHYGPGFAGMSPYLGSVMFPIPRSIYPSKPVPGSITEGREGTPSRLVPSSINPDDTINNVGVSPLAVSIWHWGWLLGSFIFAFAGYINLHFIDMALTSGSVFIRALTISLIPVPGFINIFPSPDVALKNIVTILIFYLVVGFINNGKKSLHRLL